MSKIIDSHCHPQFPQYDADRGEMIRRAQAAGIGMICIGTDLETSKKGIELAHEHEDMWATVGLHPNDVDASYDIQAYHKLVTDRKVIAIGEIGLDYYRTQEPEKQERQKEVFKEFLDLAVWYDKPVVLHSRDAGKGSTGRVHADILTILSRFKESGSRIRGVTHSFTGNSQEAQEYLKLGFYLGFNGIITFSRQYDDMIRAVPLDRILLETDAPFLAPDKYRGQRNEPVYIIDVAKKLSDLKSEPLGRVLEQMTQNCKELFRIS